MINLFEIVGGLAKSNKILLDEINEYGKLTDDHKELLSRQILSELLNNYLVDCWKLLNTPNREEIINLFYTDKKMKVINKFFFIPYEIISKDDRLKKLSSTEGIRLD